MRTLLVALLLLISGLAPGTYAAPTPVKLASYCYEHELDDGRPRRACISLSSYTADVCDTIQRFALSASLPPDYFAR